VRKIRLTGGEPLLRKNIEGLVEQLAKLRTPGGEPLALTLTTNGSLLARKAAALKAAGLQRVTVSLDSLDDAVFRRMNDVDFPVADVLAGIDAALAAGLGPIKVNMVVKRGTNEHGDPADGAPLPRHHGRRAALHRIHGRGRHQRLAHGRGAALGRRHRAHLHAEFPLVPLEPPRPAKPPSAGAMPTAAAKIGVISSVTQAFCGDCNRARLSTEGKLYLCLFASQGHDLRPLLRGGASDDDIASAIGHIWQGRADRYSELRAARPRTTSRAATRHRAASR
jgi:cyclic pyranopterin phosphate synthase